MIKRITHESKGRYTGRTNVAWKKLQQVEDLEQLHNESIFELVKPPFVAKTHIHNISTTGSITAVCDCDNFVFSNEYHHDNYCSNCGRKIDWSDIDVEEYFENKKKVLEVLGYEKVSDNV